MKISKETCELVDKLVTVRHELDEKIREESGGLYHLCCGHELHVQISPALGRVNDLAELEDFVGSFRPRYEYEDGTKSYIFMLGNDALGVIVMPADTTDSRMAGGEADDVCVDEKA